jgi:hypothetical protein
MKRRHERGTWSTQNSRSEHFRSPKSTIFCTIIDHHASVASLRLLFTFAPE